MVQQFHHHREILFIHPALLFQKADQGAKQKENCCPFILYQGIHRLCCSGKELFFHKICHITGIEQTNGIYGQRDNCGVLIVKLKIILLHRLFPKFTQYGRKNVSAKIDSNDDQIKNSNGFNKNTQHIHFSFFLSLSHPVSCRWQKPTHGWP